MARVGIQPALCRTSTPRSAGSHAVELRLVADVGEEPEQVPAVGGREAAVRRAQRPEAARGEPERPQQRGQVPRGRVLADPEGGLLVDADAGCATRACVTSYPPYISVSVSPIDAHQVVDASAPALVEPPSQTIERVRGLVVGRDEHLAEQAVDVRARRRDAVCSASTVVAIASLSVEAAGKSRRAFQAAPAPPVRLWT